MPEEVLLPELSVGDDQAGSIKAQATLLSKALSRRVDFRVPKRGEAANLGGLSRAVKAFEGN